MRGEYRTPEEVPTVRWIEHPRKPGVYLPVHRRPLRHPGVDYANRSCLCSVTYSLRSSEAQLKDALGDVAWAAILECRDHSGFTLHAACMMPDHVHALLAPTGSGESVSDIVRSLKLRQVHAVHDRFGPWLRWQRSFWDHVLSPSLQDSDEYETICWYLRQNPVRAGLVSSVDEYPYAL